MKRSLMVVSAMMISSFIFAQNDDAAAPQRQHGNGYGYGDRRESMKTVLNLDDKQMSSIEDINKKYRDKGKEQMKGLNEQRETEINKVLTPEQNKKWTDYKKERADKFAKARDERLKKNLSLTDDQLTKLKSTLSEEQINKMAFGGRNGGFRGYRGHGGRGDRGGHGTKQGK
jgi:Spy/CpxP family protein refolding chaperone